MSRWETEFETEILGQTPRAKCAKSAKSVDLRSFGTFGTFGTSKPPPQSKTDLERVLSLRSIPDIDEPHNDDVKERQHIIEAVKAADGRISIEDDRIMLRWYGDFLGGLIDRILANRIAVFLTAHHEGAGIKEAAIAIAPDAVADFVMGKT